MTLSVIIAAAGLLLAIAIDALGRLRVRAAANGRSHSDRCGDFADAPTAIGTRVGLTDGAHSVTGEIDVSNLATRLETEAAQLIHEHSQRGLSGEALAEAVSARLRDLPISEQGAGETAPEINLQGKLYAQDRFLEEHEVVRSEVLDENTCASCRELDGTVYTIDSPEYVVHMPPNDCEHGELCRGFYLRM